MATRRRLTSSPSGNLTSRSVVSNRIVGMTISPSGERRLGIGDRSGLRRDVGVVQRLGVREPHLGAVTDELEAALLERRRVGVLEHDLVAALAVDLVGRDVEVE